MMGVYLDFVFLGRFTFLIALAVINAQLAQVTDGVLANDNAAVASVAHVLMRGHWDANSLRRCVALGLERIAVPLFTVHYDFC